MTPYTGIRDCGLEWEAGQLQRLTIPCLDMAEGRTLADFTSFVFTIREDPEWPRSGSRLTVPLDPSEAGGTPAVQSTGTPDTPPGINVVFSFNVPLNPGFRRYAMSMSGLGGAGGPVRFYPTTWLTVLPGAE